MFPFASRRGQIQAWAPGDPLQQPLAFQTHSTVPPWPIPGVYNADPTAAAFPGLMAPLICPNFPPMMQNNQAGIFPGPRWQLAAPQSLNRQLQAPQLLGLSRGAPRNLRQFQGQWQSRNVVNLPHPGVSYLANNLPQNFNSVRAMPNVYSLSPQTMMIRDNKIGDRNSHALSQPQDHLYEVTGRVVEPNNCPRKGSHKNVLKHKKTELRCCWKQQFKNSKGMKTNMEITGRIVVKKRREGKAQRAMNIQSSLRDKQMCRPHKYNVKKIQQWVKGRGKHFPTRRKIEKKLAQGGFNGDGTDGDAKLQCQQPKEGLARQAKLGVQVRRNPPRRCDSRPKVLADDTDGDAKLQCQQPKEVLARQAELGVQIRKLPPRPCPFRPKVLAGTKVDSTRTLKMTDQFPNKEAELGVLGAVPQGCICEPKHQDSREANITEVLKMTGNVPNRSNKKRKRQRQRNRPSIRMVDSSRAKNDRSILFRGRIRLGCEPKHHHSEKVNTSGVLKTTDNIPNKSNKKRKMPWLPKKKAKVRRQEYLTGAA